MAGQLETAIVEIRLMYDSFLSLMEINQNLPPDCVVECLEKYFGNGNSYRSMLTSASTRDQIKTIKNLQTAYEAYQTLSKTSPKSAPTALIKTLDAILTPSNLNLVKTEIGSTIPFAQSSTSFSEQDDTRDDQSDSSIEIIDVKSLQNSSGNNNNDDDDTNNDEEWEENDSPSNLDDALVKNEEVVRETLPSTSTSSLPNPLQHRVKNRVHRQPSPTVTRSRNKKRANVDAMEVALQNTSTANSENIQQNASEIASNEGSSSSSDFSSNLNQTGQQNDSGIQVIPENRKVYECSYGCGKVCSSKTGQLLHEKIHCGSGLINCDFCDRQFTTRQQCGKHQKTHQNQTPAVKKRRQKRFTPYSKPFRCDFCYVKFVNLESFERHRAFYNQERLHKCRFPPCTRGFCYKNDLDNHERAHHKLQIVNNTS